VPTLLVRGRESDVVGPRGVEEFLEAVPHARFVDVTGAGHMVAGDRNDVFTEAVVEFLREAAF
jgi:pimeloyl-ACP methyl ester carboxylesterase